MRITISLLFSILIINLSLQSMESNYTEQKNKNNQVIRYNTDLPALIQDTALTTICSQPLINIKDTLLFRCGVLSTDHYYRSLAISAITSQPITRHIHNELIHKGLIKTHPPTDSMPVLASHMAVRYGVNYTIRTALSATLKNLTDQYDKKNDLLQKLNKTYKLATCEIDMSSDVDYNPLQQWRPQDNKATRHINLYTEISQTSEPIHKYLINMIYHNGDITINERVPLCYFNCVKPQEKIDGNDNSTVIHRSTYDTSATFWNYYLPLGRTRFRHAMEDLRRDVFDNHLTLVGCPLNQILITESESIDL